MTVEPEPELLVDADTPRLDPTDRAAIDERVERDLAEAEAEQDPEKALGFDVTDLPPAELARHGISLRPHPRIADVPQTGRFWLTHSEAAGRYPKADKIARATARDAARFWWRRKRTLEGLTLNRSFPCLGKYRVTNDGAESGPVVVVCDVCGDMFTVRRDEFAKALEDSLK